MKALNNQNNKIVFNNWEVVKTTSEYRQKVENIKNEINLKYKKEIENERNLIRKFLLKIRKRKELKRTIDQLTSLDKLYLAVK